MKSKPTKFEEEIIKLAENGVDEDILEHYSKAISTLCEERVREARISEIERVIEEYTDGDGILVALLKRDVKRLEK